MLQAAVTLLGHNRQRIDKKVRAHGTGAKGLEVVRPAERDMGRQLGVLVSELLEQGGPEEVAVLTRVNVGLLVPQVSLTEAGIPVESALDTLTAQVGSAQTATDGAPAPEPTLARGSARPGRFSNRRPPGTGSGNFPRRGVPFGQAQDGR